MPRIINKRIPTLPEKPGVYLFLDNRGSFLYIGKAINIKKRVQNHFTRPTYSDKLFIDYVTAIRYIRTESEPAALILESQLIKQHKPRYNILLRDDKQYFYVGFAPPSRRTKGQKPLPILTLTHQPQNVSRISYLISRKSTDRKPRNTKYTIRNTTYIGPFTDGRSLKLVLKYLRKVFPYYTSGNSQGTARPHRKLPCSYCHIALCPGPNPNVAEYKKNIAKIKAILRGQKPRVITSLRKEMQENAKNLKFEKATKIRDQIKALENIFSHKSQAPMINDQSNPKPLPRRQAGKTPKLDIRSFGHSLGVENWELGIFSLEAYDISNIQGREPVASMVRFDNGAPNKSLYRKFRVRLLESPNDPAMIREVILRRLRHAEWPYPDLFLVDGGRGQLNAARRAFRESGVNIGKSLLLASLAKHPDRLFFPEESRGTPLTALPQELNHLLTYARDEAHRFAISYHRKLHAKKIVS